MSLTKFFFPPHSDFDLVNVHLFHDAHNVVAWKESPSYYAGIRQKAMDFVLQR